eukprot:g47227.t1
MLPATKKALPDPALRPLYCDVTGIWPEPGRGGAGGWSADLIGRHDCVKGAKLRIHFGPPTPPAPQGPDNHALRGLGPDELRALAARLLSHCVPALRRALPSLDQVVSWLQSAQEAHTTFVGQGHHVEVLDLGASTNDLHTRVEQPEARLLGQRLTPAEFNSRFRAKPCSSEHARHKTLALFPSRWQQLPPRPTLTPAQVRAQGLVSIGAGQEYYELGAFGAAVALDFVPPAAGPAEPELAVLGAEHDYRAALALARQAPATDAGAHDFRRGCRLYRRRFRAAPEGVPLQDLSPGYLKSLLQKLIRYGSAHPSTEVPEWKHSAALLLRWAGFAVDWLRAGRSFQCHTGGRLPPLPPPDDDPAAETALRSQASAPPPSMRERCLPASAWPMPPWHCLDHHCCSTLPLLLPAKAGGGEWLPGRWSTRWSACSHTSRARTAACRAARWTPPAPLSAPCATPRSSCSPRCAAAGPEG